jgi:hypothetical protein
MVMVMSGLGGAEKLVGAAMSVKRATVRMPQEIDFKKTLQSVNPFTAAVHSVE